jgi:uncharacterized ferredoxin-like protein
MSYEHTIFDLDFGTVVKTKSIRNRHMLPDGMVETTHSAPKGKCFVTVVVGICDDDEVDVNAEEMLNQMGWVQKDILKERRVSEFC